MKRKLALLLFAALVSASLLTGCQKPDTNTPDGTEITDKDTSDTSDNTENTGDTDNAENTENNGDSAATAGYAEAYLEAVNAFNDEYDNADKTTYGLVDFDGKGAPELVIAMPGFISMYTYADGKTYTLIDGWGLGVGGVGGYDYIPGGNVLRSFESDFAGAVRYESYYHIDEKYRFEPLYEKALYTALFDDKNRNQTPDEDEPIDENTKHLYYGESELSPEDYASMQIEGDYQELTAEMSFDELKKALA